MGVYVKGIEMPKNCNECPLHFYEGQAICSCRALHAIDDDEILKPWKNKRKDCPLIELPPHGRLIDADELIVMEYCGIKFVPKEFIDDAPTIIPAEEEN